MSCYTPKRKTSNGLEEVTIPISAIKGLSEKLDDLNIRTPDMPMIRFANAYDTQNTMVIGPTNPLNFSIEIVCGQLQIGDEVQICTRQLFTYKSNLKRKYRLRKQWKTAITNENVNSKFIHVTIAETSTDIGQRLFRTGTSDTKTLSALYIRIRRPVCVNGIEVDGDFSNVITVWKKYDLNTGKVFIK